MEGLEGQPPKDRRMTALRLVPPDGADWTIDTESTADGVELAIAFILDGKPITARFALDRQAALALARSILTDAGDATHRRPMKPVEALDG